MANNKRDLKLFVRIDGSGRTVSGSGVYRIRKPKVGNWVEIQANECCTTTTTTTATPTTTTTTTV